MNSIAIIEAVNTTSLPFNGQHIITAMAAGVAYVAMKPIAENLGLSWGTQQQKLARHMDKFGCIHMNIPSLGGLQRMLCLPLKKLNGWLFSINPAKVRDDIRDRLVRYQEECFTALHDYWTKGAAIRKPETTVDDRTPLRGIVNRIMGKYGMTYQAVYKLVHKEFGVKHIDELSPRQTAEAVEYLAAKVIEGEFIGKTALPSAAFDFDMAAHHAHSINVHLQAIKELWRGGLEEALELIEYKNTGKISERLADITFHTAPLGRQISKHSRKRIH